ncbi:MAG TPA: DMT family transporter [Anaerolineales bacterium]|nr:DMT family transporter [Anaerolineales bacterium]HNF33740.1 DMT family transporter [Anaerolineales bacterium]HNH03888.1 DMT family transporter [Anaerolineales bacterium]HNO83712.1 DMT family transporter [Anaerolineales bacterium]
MNFIGEIAGLATSFFFAITAIIFASVGRMVGSQVTNRFRLLFALFYLVILNLILFHEPLPFSAGSPRWLWLSLSGVIGLSLGDAFLFRSYVAVGPRLGSLLLSLAPIFGSVIAWIFFGETLTALQILGILLALAGIGWVVTSHKEEANTPKGHTREGIIFGVLAGLGQAVGLVLSKQAMAGGFSPFQANAIRMLAAVIFTWAWTAVEGQISSTVETIRNHPKALQWIAFGAVIGPVLGVSSSLLAVQHAEIGVASTLMALPPVIVLPISYFVFKEKIGWQGIAGTFLAILGVAVLFLA